MQEGAGTALIDTFNSSKRGVKPSVVLKSDIPGQTGCLYGDCREGVEGERRHSWLRLDAGNGYGVTGQHHVPHNTLQPQGLSILHPGR